ncbi:MAG: hypothetical protein AAGM04_02125 [Pseudomonadota bacterium]
MAISILCRTIIFALRLSNSGLYFYCTVYRKLAGTTGCTIEATRVSPRAGRAKTAAGLNLQIISFMPAHRLSMAENASFFAFAPPKILQTKNPRSKP